MRLLFGPRQNPARKLFSNIPDKVRKLTFDLAVLRLFKVEFAVIEGDGEGAA
jgi:hypothetical protein